MNRAIVHFDGDSFFASVEQALNHTLRGKPVVTGAERGAATSVSYEAKRLGVTRSMTLKQIREICPGVVVVNSDYRAYAIYAHRMYAIVRRYTPAVEEYSVDECFADITGLEKQYGLTYPQIAELIKNNLEEALGITFGVGLAPTKVLAKTASKFNKPAGFTHITAANAPEYLAKIAVGNVWGIGTATNFKLMGLGLVTALDFANQTLGWLTAQGFAKPHRAIWYELNAKQVFNLSLTQDAVVQSIIKSRTFSPPSTNKAFVYSQLSKNVEKACEKARLNSVRPRAISFMLKTQSFLYGRVELNLPVATADPSDILRVLQPHFDKLFRKGVLYRATGITLRSIITEHTFTPDFFGEGARTNTNLPVLKSVDDINRWYGAQSIFLGASLTAITYREKSRVKKEGLRKGKVLLPSDIKRKSLDIPFLGLAK
jgi:nucleotidyltransferase/DNA polymerase involved in DNA repair